ncbi:MAG: RNA polymerase sigma factor [Eubacteriales bacterium]|nr:RNA polymerase sigma factor [Eubacteriales bacterium]
MMYRTSKIKEIYDRNWDSLYRLCLIYMQNQEDACDMVQETFVRLLQYIGRQEEKTEVFRDEDHERAWLRTVACNLCKNELRHWWRRKRQEVEAIENLFEPGQAVQEHGEILEDILEMPEKYRVLIYLHYYEGYSVEEIGNILKEKPSTLRSRISKGRKLLEKKLKEDGYGKEN